LTVDSFIETFIVPLLIIIGVIVGLFIAGGVLYLIHFLLTMPMRRAGRARFFLDLVEAALDRGQPVEEALISAVKSRDRMLGWHFQNLAAMLAGGKRLGDALAFVPRLLPPQVVAMFNVGQKIGDLKKVLPACRQLLRDSVSKTVGATNYLVVLTFVVTPLSMVVFALLCTRVLPVMHAISEGMEATPPAMLAVLWEHASLILIVQGVVMFTLWVLGFIYVAGPRALEWLPFLHQLFFRLPWHRKRMNRDFSIMLAVLLDAHVPEAEAVQLAADCTANRMFQKRADRVAQNLKQGMKLTDAIQAMDDAGEFRWRLTNATHVTDGFRAALAGWHEALDAKAFQQEQTAAHSVSTALVLLNGLFVGVVVTSVFGFLISIINAGVIW
jgi:type II secretory pathway component PulF